MAHDAIFEAALLQFHTRSGKSVQLPALYKRQIALLQKEELYEFLKPQFAKWWLPDDIVFMQEIPKTSVGKFLKQALRKELEHLHKEK